MAPATKRYEEIPGPRGVPLLGHARELWRDPLGMLVRSHRDYGDRVRFRFGPFRFVSTLDPDDIEHVFIRNHRNYTKSRGYRGMKLVLGNGLVTSEGDFWRRQRLLVQPAFHHRCLRGFAATMAEATGDLVRRWEGLDDGAELDVHEEMIHLTFRIVGRTLFSTELDAASSEIGRALGEALKYAAEYSEALLMPPPWIPTPRNRRFQRALGVLDGMVHGIIEERRRLGEQPEDLLSLLMAATDEAGEERMTDRQLRDEVMTLAAAGHETTANALAWTWSLLARHPEVVRRLCAELDEVLGGRPVDFDDLPRLAYTEQVVQEAMRLYPPAWIFDREAREADVLGGYRIPARAAVGVSPYVLHRDPRFWDSPARFDPDRFSPERSAGRPRHAYLPFGVGPRICIGRSFAMMEAKIIVAMVAQRFRMTLTTDEPIGMEPGITLRPRGGVRVRLRRRPAAPAARPRRQPDAAPAAQSRRRPGPASPGSARQAAAGR